MMLEMLKGTSTATTSNFNEPLTLEKLMAAKKTLDDLGPDPMERLKEWMRKKGFAPEDGGVLVLPEKDYLLCGFGNGLFRSPDFVRPSNYISKAILINPPKRVGESSP